MANSAAPPVVWITRTPEGARTTARAVKAMGCDVVLAPVLRVTPLKPTIDPHSFGALIFTSRNGLNAFCAVCNRRAVTVYCVGDATAEAARAQKFHKVSSAHGDVAALHALLQKEADRGTRLLYAASTAPAAPLTRQLLDDGFLVHEVAVYETRAVTPAISPTDLARISHVLIHSPKAARAVAKVLMEHHDKIAFNKPTFICISEAACQALTEALAAGGQDLVPHIRVAAAPDEASMLRLLDQTG